MDQSRDVSPRFGVGGWFYIFRLFKSTLWQFNIYGIFVFFVKHFSLLYRKVTFVQLYTAYIQMPSSCDVSVSIWRFLLAYFGPPSRALMAYHLESIGMPLQECCWGDCEKWPYYWYHAWCSWLVYGLRGVSRIIVYYYVMVYNNTYFNCFF